MTESQSVCRTATRYHRGRSLESITVNYCTALGLIQAGVLPKPNNPWDEHRMVNPLKRGNSSNRHAVNVELKRIKYGVIMEDGSELATASKECDFLDLSGAPSDDDGE